MQERIERSDAADELPPRPPEHARDDLRQRLERLSDGHPSSDGYRGSAWEAAEFSSNEDRPAESDVRATADRAQHILDGDQNSDGGGHRHGTGRPGKTEFPAAWPDNVIISVIEDVSRRPDSVEWQPNGRWRVAGDHDGVRVNAVIERDGRIWTAWPEPGGKGVVQNPEAS